MRKWLALMGPDGKELDYYGYSRQPVPDPLPEEWLVVDFAAYNRPEPTEVICAWICDSETSRMRDGQMLDVKAKVERGTKVNIHINGGPHAG